MPLKTKKDLGPLGGQTKVMQRAIKEAFYTLKLMPMPGSYLQLSKMGSSMPEVKQDLTVDNYQEAMKERRQPSKPVPNRHAITRMDDILDLLFEEATGLTKFERELLVLRALKWSWPKIAEKDVERRSVRRLQAIHTDALVKMLRAHTIKHTK